MLMPARVTEVHFVQGTEPDRLSPYAARLPQVVNQPGLVRASLQVAPPKPEPKR
jgi:hypothetical protein